MELYLVQHGASKTEAEDPQRGLNKEGQGVVEQVAGYLGSLGLALDRIEHSEKLRARQTAEILAARLQPREGTKEIAGITPNDDVEPMRERLRLETKKIMLVGHLPYLSRLAAALLVIDAERPIVQFHMGGVVRLDRNEQGQWTLRWAIIPDLIVAHTAREKSAA